MFSFHANNNREITVAFSDALKFEAILVLWTHPGDISRFLKKNSPNLPKTCPDPKATIRLAPSRSPWYLLDTVPPFPGSLSAT